MKKQKVAIIGVGLLGGSLALALKRQKGIRLISWNHRAVSRKKAARLLPVAPTLEKAVENANVIVLCSHSVSVSEFLPPLLKQAHPDVLIMDVSSVKKAIVNNANRIPGASLHFVPCHPMAGKEKSGPEHADSSLYREKVVFITPLKGTPRALLKRAVHFWKSVGGLAVVLEAGRHDRYVALTSHLPHLLASALVTLYDDHAKKDPKFRKAVGSGFRDMTRIAAGSPAMWADILFMNAGQVLALLSQYRKMAAALEKGLRSGNRSRWKKYFEKARRIRESL
jgi:prephenate dehydrogenase